MKNSFTKKFHLHTQHNQLTDEEQAIKMSHVQQLSPDILRVKEGGNSIKLFFTSPISVRVSEELFSLLKVHIT